MKTFKNRSQVIPYEYNLKSFYDQKQDNDKLIVFETKNKSATPNSKRFNE